MAQHGRVVLRTSSASFVTCLAFLRSPSLLESNAKQRYNGSSQKTYCQGKEKLRSFPDGSFCEHSVTSCHYGDFAPMLFNEDSITIFCLRRYLFLAISD